MAENRTLNQTKGRNIGSKRLLQVKKTVFGYASDRIKGDGTDHLQMVQFKGISDQ